MNADIRVHVIIYTPCSFIVGLVGSAVVKSVVSTSVVVDFCGVDVLHCRAVELALIVTVDITSV